MQTYNRNLMKPLLQQIHNELEGMKVATPASNDIPFDWGCEDSETEHKRKGYNLAISDIQARLPNLINKIIKTIDWKEEHLCGFNDGEQICDCMKKTKKVFLSALKTLLH